MHAGGAGRKREWQPMESSADREDHHKTQAQLCIHSNGGRNVHGEVIEKEMKKLQLAHDYCNWVLPNCAARCIE
ncbi:hypothetical protein Gpo141_00002509 [Globisporangium polare]